MRAVHEAFLLIDAHGEGMITMLDLEEIWNWQAVVSASLNPPAQDLKEGKMRMQGRREVVKAVSR